MHTWFRSSCERPISGKGMIHLSRAFASLFLIVTMLLPGITMGTVASAASDAVIYDDALAADWADWSWSATLDFANTSPTYGGSTRSISVDYTAAWGRLSLRRSTPLDTTGYDRIAFKVHGGSSGTRQLDFYTQTTDTGGESPYVTVDAPAGVWTDITINLSDLGNPAQIALVNLMDRTGIDQPVFYIDLASIRTEPASWYDCSFDYRQEISIQASEVVSDLTNFPVLIHLNSNADLAADAQDDGDDILFTSSNGTTKLSHEIISFNGSSGELIAWVKVPNLSSTQNTDLYMYYGNPSIGSQENATDVWSNGYEAVLHLHESGGGVDDEYADSSGLAHHGTGGGVAGSGNSSQTPIRTGGLFGYAQDFDDTDPSPDLIRLDPVSDQAWTAITVQAWINPHDIGDNRVFSKTWGTNVADIVWQLGKTSLSKIRHRTNSSNSTFESGSTFSLGSWTHFAYTWTAGSPGPLKVYHNGQIVIDSSLAGTDLYNDSIEPTIGNVPDGSRGFDGLIQETRLSNVVRSQAWLETEYNNQFSPSTFYNVYSEETDAAFCVPTPFGDVTSQGISFPNVTLNGQDLIRIGSTTAWTVESTYPAGTGWHVTIQGSDFTDGSHTLGIGYLETRLLDADIVVISGSGPPSSTMPSDTTMSTVPQTMLQASGANGVGIYEFTPGFRLSIPAEAYIGTYTASIVATFIVGP